MSFVMKRILGIEKKNRITRTVRIEKELYEIVKTNALNLSNTINIALEEHFRKRNLIK